MHLILSARAQPLARVVWSKAALCIQVISRQLIIFARQLSPRSLLRLPACTHDDRYGRWKISATSAAFVGVFGLASAFAMSFEVLALLRGLVGVGIGGLSVPFDILAELVGPAERGRSLMAVEFFWSVRGSGPCILQFRWSLGTIACLRARFRTPVASTDC